MNGLVFLLWYWVPVCRGPALKKRIAISSTTYDVTSGEPMIDERGGGVWDERQNLVRTPVRVRRERRP
jgi:hypothetical protein